MIEVGESEGVAVVTLAHGKVNALDIELCRAMTQTFRGIDGGPHRGVVLTGAGSAFSAGVDLWRVIDGGGDYVDELAAPETLVNYAVSQAARPASTIPPATFRATKRHLNRLPDPSPYDAEVVWLWRERVADGWIAGYMARTMRK